MKSVPRVSIQEDSLLVFRRVGVPEIQCQTLPQMLYETKFSDAVVDQLVAWNSDPLVGARAIKQLINRNLLPLFLSIECLNRLTGKLPINHIDVNLEASQIIFEIT